MHLKFKTEIFALKVLKPEQAKHATTSEQCGKNAVQRRNTMRRSLAHELVLARRTHTNYRGEKYWRAAFLRSAARAASGKGEVRDLDLRRDLTDVRVVHGPRPALRVAPRVSGGSRGPARC